ncbi:MAG: DUF3658 domain-containing protein, partial [Blautia wexlerae]
PVNLLRSLASHWVELQQENATLRAVLNGKLVSAPECLYDTFILRELEKQENEFNEARLVGQVLGKYRLGIGDAWIALRIEQFIKDGLLIPITVPEPGTPIYHRILQKTERPDKFKLIFHILGNLITVIFDYQILRKPLKILSL